MALPVRLSHGFRVRAAGTDPPTIYEPTGVWVEMAGTQIAGLRGSCENLGESVPTGAEVEMIIAIASLPVLYDIGFTTLPSNDGAWSHSFMLQPGGTHLPVLMTGGPFDVRFRIGSIGVPHLCNEFLIWPVTTIESARIVTDGYIPAEPTTWGGVKAMYR
jgi:hypothetical protein